MPTHDGSGTKLAKRVPSFRVTERDWTDALGDARSRQLHVTNIAREALHFYLFMRKRYPDQFDSFMRKCFSPHSKAWLPRDEWAWHHRNACRSL